MPATRFKIPELPDFFFEAENRLEGSAAVKMNIDNISISGMALEKSEKMDWAEIGSEIIGALIKGKKRVETKAKIIHQTHDLIGCQFLESLPKIEYLVSEDLLKDLFPSLKGP